MVGYLLASVMLLMRFSGGPGSRFGSRFLYLGVGAGALILHAVSLYQTLLVAGVVDLGFYNALSLVAWLIVTIATFTAVVKPVESLLIIIYPLAVIVLVLQYYLHDPGRPDSLLSFGLQFHILLSLVAYSLLAIATLQAFMLYIQEYTLRNKHFTGLFNILPPMQTTESLLIQLIMIGFFLLSLSLASGLMFIHNIFAQHLAHKTVFSIFAWFVYGILLWGRWRLGWRGITVVKWALGGFSLLLLAYFGSKMVLELILKRV